jgi:arylsulfatase A-like enzyme
MPPWWTAWIRKSAASLAQLKAMKAYDNTLIFFASDNGASAEIMVRNGGHNPQAEPGSAETYLCLGPGFSSAANTPHRRHKTWVHEGGISTPLIAHWPKGITAKNELRTTPAHMIDIVPTILEIAGIEKPKEWKGEPIPEAPGRSLAPAFAKDETISRDSLWWLHEGNRAVRVGDWKLVAAEGDPWELYDLKTDRAEQHNLAARCPKKPRNWNKYGSSKPTTLPNFRKRLSPSNPRLKLKEKAKLKARKSKIVWSTK